MNRRRLLITLIAASLPVTVACSPGPVRDDASLRVTILATATGAEPAAALTPAVLQALRQVAGNRAAERILDAGVAVITTADGAPPRRMPLVPRRVDGSVERGSQRERLIDQSVSAVGNSVAGLASGVGEIDLLDAIARAVRSTDGGTLVVGSSGLPTAGSLDMRLLGWSAEPSAVAADLRARGVLPALAGWRMIFVGLGSTAGLQPPLGTAARSKLAGYWLAICLAAHALSCAVDETSTAAGPPVSTAPVPVVPVPDVTSVIGPHGEVTTTVTDALLGFAADSAVISSDGRTLILSIAAQVRAMMKARPGTSVTVHGYTADPADATAAGMARTARERSDAVVAVLVAAGLPDAAVESLGGGKAPGTTAVVDGVFDETRAAAMRRVEITYGS